MDDRIQGGPQGRIAGVSRGNEFSPNHVGNDAAIFRLTADALRRMGYQVDTYTEEEFVQSGHSPRAVFHMARHPRTIARLRQLEDGGAVVVNPARGIENCVREPMTRLLLENHVPHPRSFVHPVGEPFPHDIFPCWIKRGDSCAMVKADVVYAECREDALRVMEDFGRRGIPRAVVNEHLVGDLVKFYGVRGTDFFYTFYPDEQSHSKFGLEAVNGRARGYRYDRRRLQDAANRAARVLGVHVYGGDCVIDSRGGIRIIDFNDWPSFARCRDEAAPAIAACIHRLVQEQNERETENPSDNGR